MFFLKSVISKGHLLGTDFMLFINADISRSHGAHIRRPASGVCFISFCFLEK